MHSPPNNMISLEVRLQERLLRLGLPLLKLWTTGEAKLEGSCTLIEETLVRSEIFLAALRAEVNAGNLRRGTALELFPHIWVIALNPPKPGRPVPRLDREPPIFIVPALTRGVSQCPQLAAIAREQKLDYAGLRAMAGSAALMESAEIARLATMLDYAYRDAQDVDRRNREIHAVSHQLLESYEEISLLYKFSTRMSVNRPPEEFLGDACLELRQVLGFQWLGIVLSVEQSRLGNLAGFSFLDGRFPGTKSDMTNLGRTLLHQQRGAAGPELLSHDELETIDCIAGRARQVLTISLSRGSEQVGVLMAGDKSNGGPISTTDATLCSSLAGTLSIFLENVMLYEDSQAMFLGVLHSLTASIDAKDSYTHGHSERVALLSRRLAEAMGLEPAICERIYLAGLVHDVGKIGVPESVLTKPASLTADEFAQIKLHPEIGARILQDIPQMRDLIPGVMHHHERWDGRGYPAGLRGAEIPLFGRIIGLADSFDAMSSDRSYRAGMNLHEVLDEIERCRNQQFDPELATIFVRMDFTEYERMLDDHHARSVRRLSA
ncbi:MAG: HD domain-containing protein [Phycisphaeraceae bacterium]|nr:HD domain-containing protein [Phycisphaeraceae bacterium]